MKLLINAINFENQFKPGAHGNFTGDGGDHEVETLCPGPIVHIVARRRLGQVGVHVVGRILGVDNGRPVELGGTLLIRCGDNVIDWQGADALGKTLR